MRRCRLSTASLRQLGRGTEIRAGSVCVLVATQRLHSGATCSGGMADQRRLLPALLAAGTTAAAAETTQPGLGKRSREERGKRESGTCSRAE